jgi:hypothetical protein
VDAETLAEISRVLKIDDAVLRHMATRHIAGSRTTAPRDDAAAVPAAVPAEAADDAPAETTPVPDEPATAVSEEAEPEYAGAEEQEQPAEEEE